jgi:glycogen synthase
VYGGAGIHVAELTRELRRRIAVDVRTFGSQHEAADGWSVRGVSTGLELSGAPEALRPALAALGRDIGMLADPISADVVHCHTWYTHFAGILARLALGVPLVITVHSLEPQRPWKREQLGGGYDLAAWVERTALEMADAVIAVSRETREDVLRLFHVAPERVHVIQNGIDADFYRPDDRTDALQRYGIDPGQPYVLFVGRITRQKGIVHLLRAVRRVAPEVPIVLCAGQADTPELATEVEVAVQDLQRTRREVVWIRAIVERTVVRQLYSHAGVLYCPSVYEPFGIINLEAIACTAVVASAVGGIPEVGRRRRDRHPGAGHSRQGYAADRCRRLRARAGGGDRPADAGCRASISNGRRRASASGGGFRLEHHRRADGRGVPLVGRGTGSRALTAVVRSAVP